MSTLGWALLAAAVGVIGTPPPTRIGALALAGRLAGGSTAAPAHRRWNGATAAAGGAGVVGVLAIGVGPLIALAGGAAVGVGALLVVDRRRDRAERRCHRDHVTAVGVLAGELTAGARPADALAAAAAAGPSVGPVLGSAAVTARRGADAAEVLLAADQHGLRALGVAWRLVDSTGVALAAVVDRVATDLSGADEQRRAVAVALAGPRSSALVLSGLPVVGVALGAAMGARPLDLLLGTTAGQALSCAGVLLDLAGILWIRRIVARASE